MFKKFKKFILYVTLLVTLIIPKPSYCADWSTFDIISQTLVLTSFVLDAGQTKDIKNHPAHTTTLELSGATITTKHKGLYETNPILGKHPSDTQIDLYFISSMVIHTLVANYIPDVVEYFGGSESTAKKSRTLWQYTWLGIQLNEIENNYKIGLKLDF